MRWLEARVPPPLVAAACAGGAWLAARMWPSLALPSDIVEPWRIPLALVLAAIGASFDVAGVLAFRRLRTTVNPMTPAKASALAVGGVYRLTRNPMYVGMAFLLAGWAVYLAHPAGLAAVVVFVAYITRFQILPEEAALAEKFGPAFAEYRRKTRRWL